MQSSGWNGSARGRTTLVADCDHRVSEDSYEQSAGRRGAVRQLSATRLVAPLHGLHDKALAGAGTRGHRNG
jgi:hypothetical protein